MKKYVANYILYLKDKYARTRKKDQYQFLSAPKRPFQKLILNFIIKLLESKNKSIEVNYDIIYTLINKLTKYVKFIPYKITINIEQLLTLLLKKVFINYNIFKQIISDRNKLFTSKFSIELKKALKLKKEILIFFYSQIDKQTKKINQILE